MNIGDPDTPRWVQRLDNFGGAMVLLREGIELVNDPAMPPIVAEGLIQRFEFTFELAWKTLKDYLVWRKVTLDRQGPADVIKAAFAAGYIDEGAVWIEALDARNLMSHVYRRQAFERVVREIETCFMDRFEALYDMLLIERVGLEDG
ncbi:nucleotidyltransferase substrate binding protein [Sphingomonas sp.]|uniref:nucleotidyltransferase substrate binding protein n=1 Tax=Sphingomonas sp. TaxID=28214 RepID=UPI0035BBF71F